MEFAAAEGDILAAQREFSPADIRWGEDLLVSILDRATALGYTSRPAGQASAAARKAVQARLRQPANPR